MVDAAPGAMHGPMGRLSWTIEALSLLSSVALVVVHLARLLAAPEWFASFWTVPIVAMAMVVADFTSGIVHWSADTWGRETLPVVGPRFLRPFRIHHINPDDFCERSFVDANGDVAMLTLPVLALVFALPIDALIGQMLALFLVSYCACTLPTNQSHQWAHLSTVPRPVAWLQRIGLLLRPDAHAAHHRAPYVANYCILTGWCNRPLTAIQFFPRLERLITRLTGTLPRVDEQIAFGVILSSPSDAATERGRQD